MPIMMTRFLCRLASLVSQEAEEVQEWTVSTFQEQEEGPGRERVHLFHRLTNLPAPLKWTPQDGCCHLLHLPTAKIGRYQRQRGLARHAPSPNIPFPAKDYCFLDKFGC